jgi:hypothetical protein
VAQEPGEQLVEELESKSSIPNTTTKKKRSHKEEVFGLCF